MVEVTRLGGGVFYINSDQIETVESTPDTVITLVNGRKYVVLETSEHIVSSIISFRKKCLSSAVLG